MTIHVIMGSTVPVLVTEIGMSRDGCLWEAAQVVVLLSRTHYAKDIYFVDNADIMAQVLFDCLKRGGQYSKYMLYLLDSLCRDSMEGNTPFIIDQTHPDNPFRPKDATLPPPNTLVSYILVSLRDSSKTYVGYTGNLRKRLNTHNSESGGSKYTRRPHLKPWGLLGYVVGFELSQDASRFERKWQVLTRNAQRLAAGSLNASAKMNLSQQIMSDRSYSNLRLVVCGTVEATIS